MDKLYNQYFFNDFYEQEGGGKYTDREKWMPFFDKIAENIVALFSPQTVLDAGCACGYIVEALRNRGVEAYGIDISEYAIGRVASEIKPYCIVHDIVDPLPETFPTQYDLILTIEVMEHLYPEQGTLAIANLCSYSDVIIFTSTPTDIVDPTHVNVQQPEYWCRIFAGYSFYRNLVQPMDFICPWAMLFEKQISISNVIDSYERILRICKTECRMQADGFRKKIEDQKKNLDENQHIIRTLKEEMIHTDEIKKKNQNLECDLLKSNKEYEESKKLSNELLDKNLLMTSKIKGLEADNNILSERINQIDKKNKDLELENRDLTVAYIQLENSTCWKITKPLRFIGKMLGR